MIRLLLYGIVLTRFGDVLCLFDVTVLVFKTLLPRHSFPPNSKRVSCEVCFWALFQDCLPCPLPLQTNMMINCFHGPVL